LIVVLRRPAIEKNLGRLPRLEIRKAAWPGGTLRATLQARSDIVTGIRLASEAASGTRGQASA
jgi:hypothetical protein